MSQRNFRLLSLFNFLSDFRLFSGILILYFVQETGSFALGMSIFSVAMIASAVFEVPTGIFSDRIGRKKTFICASLASVTAMTLYAIGSSYWILLAGAILEGLQRAFNSGNDSAFLHDSLASESKTQYFAEFQGKVSSMFALALMIASLLGSVILLMGGSFELLMWLSIVPQVAAFAVSLRFIEPKVFSKGETNIYSHFWEALSLFIKNPKLRWLSIADSMRFAFGEAAFLFRDAFIVLFWPVWAVGLSKTLSFGGSFLSFYFAGKVIKRIKALNSLIGEILVNRVLNLTALIFPSVLSPLLLSLTSLTFGVATTSMRALMQKEFTDKQRATMGSLGSFMNSIVFAIFAYLIGFIGDAYGPITALFIIQILLLLPLLLYYQIFKHDNKVVV